MKLKSLLILPLLVASLQAATVNDLTFALNEDGTEYSVTDCRESASGSMEIPSNYNGLPLTSLGSNAFFNCNNLSSIIIPNGLISIGSDAFRGCSSLNSITIPDSVISIEGGAFFDCASLASIIIPNGVTSIREYTFTNCSSLSSIIIPDSVTSIGRNAFASCSGLTSIAIPDGVTSIGRLAFVNCTNLTSIVIPDSVTSIGQNAFNNCSSLESITIPNSVNSIGDTAFSGCDTLASITLPYNFAYAVPENAIPTYTYDDIVNELKNDPDFIGAVAQAMLAAENNSGFATKEELSRINQITLPSDQALSTVEYGQMRFTGTESTPDIIQSSRAYSSVTLAEGDTFELLQVMSNNNHINGRGNHLVINHNEVVHEVDFYGGFPKRKVVGPGEIYFEGILPSYSSHKIAFYKITRTTPISGNN